jgi:hypothetical protein
MGILIWINPEAVLALRFLPHKVSGSIPPICLFMALVAS